MTLSLLDLGLKGRSHLLRRALNQKQRDDIMEEEKHREDKLASIPSLKEDIYYLKSQLHIQEEKLEAYSKDSEILKELYHRGLIDLDGNPL